MMAAFAVAAAGTPCKTDKECGLFRTAVAASGGVCDSSLLKTCVKLSGSGQGRAVRWRW